LGRGEGGEFDVGDFLEELGLHFPIADFLARALLRLCEKIADVGEGGGALGRHAVGGEGVEELAEDVIDVNLGDESAAGAAEFVGEVVFALGGAAVDGAVTAAETFVGGDAGHGAAASIGVLELAETEIGIGICAGHGADIAQEYFTYKLHAVIRAFESVKLQVGGVRMDEKGFRMINGSENGNSVVRYRGSEGYWHTGLRFFKARLGTRLSCSRKTWSVLSAKYLRYKICLYTPQADVFPHRNQQIL